MANEIIYALSTSPARKVTDAASEFVGLWEKELIYVGDFQKDEPDGTRIRFTVEEPTLDHWERTHVALSELGYAVPMPIEHTRDPEARRGTWLKVKRKTNERGLPALFGYAKFRDAEAEKLALSANVSIFVPPELVVNGKRFVRPIEHIALTDYPAIPGLGQFKQCLALSTSAPPVKGDTRMPLTKIAAALDIEVGDLDDEALEAKILDAIAALTEESDDEPVTADDDAPPIAASLLGLGRDNRKMKIQKLLDDGKVTPAVAKKLEADYCNDQTLQLSLSGKGDDGFDRVFATYQMNEPVTSFKSKTGSQKALALSDDRKGGENPLVKNADARAKAAAVK